MADESEANDIDDDGPLGRPMSAAVTAAEAAAQTAWSIWHQMSETQQAAWLEVSSHSYPRVDLFLRTILPAAEQIIEDERRADP